jgi:competence protein ComEC
MRFFALITLVTAFLLFWTRPHGLHNPPLKKNLPSFINKMHQPFKDQFIHPQNANLAWAMITGQKTGLSPNLSKDFKALNLSFFFSPSGIHLSAFLIVFLFFIKKIKNKKTVKILRAGILISAFWLPFLALKRIIILRLLIMTQRLFKINLQIEIIFIITFIISFFLNHFQESPLSFAMSFLFMGTFIAFGDKSKTSLILGLFSSHLLVAFFLGNEVSLVSIILSLPLVALFSFLLPFIFLYAATFHLIHFNWIESIVRLFILTIHETAKLTHGTFISSSLFIILAVWIILLKKKKRFLLLFLFLHGNALYSPEIFTAHSDLKATRAIAYDQG